MFSFANYFFNKEHDHENQNHYRHGFALRHLIPFCRFAPIGRFGCKRHTNATTNFFTTAYTGIRTDFTGNVGYEFIPSATIHVTALGRSVNGPKLLQESSSHPLGCC